jgi:phage gp46-like protein
MPEDIRIVWDGVFNEGDIGFDIAAQDLTKDEGLETAVIISLFTDRRAKEDDVLPDSNSTDRRGWWGDLPSPFVEGDQIGSRLWLLSREKTLESAIEKAKGYAEEALQWFVEDGVAAKVEVDAERQGSAGSNILALGVKIHKTSGEIVAFKYELQWIAQAERG